MTVKAYNKKVTISWKKNTKADGYQIYWCKGDEWTIPHNDYYSCLLYTSDAADEL